MGSNLVQVLGGQGHKASNSLQGLTIGHLAAHTPRRWEGKARIRRGLRKPGGGSGGSGFLVCFESSSRNRAGIGEGRLREDAKLPGKFRFQSQDV